MLVGDLPFKHADGAGLKSKEISEKDEYFLDISLDVLLLLSDDVESDSL